jgi:TfoX/Sxy family transcriptional regulator of competence genes
MAYDERTAQRVRDALGSRADVAEKEMMGGLCFMIGGHMCCSVSGRGLLVRVGADAYEAVLGEPNVTPMTMGARTMTGFVRVTPEGYRTEASLRRWLRRGTDFVATLPPQERKRRASGRKKPR